MAVTVPAFLALSSIILSALSQECGVKKSSSRVVGGRDSGGYHYPWFALLVLKRNENLPVCAGSLITPYHVLTAAHCFDIKASVPKESLFTVLMGVYDRCDRNEATRRRFGTSRVVPHEGYGRNGKFRDIAVVTLDRAADFAVACLPPPGTGDSTEPALLLGFGATRHGARRQPCRMMEAAVTKYSKSECRRTYLPKADVEEVTVVCAGDLRGGVDSCQGDSGGPLLTTTNDGRYVVVGIVSYGYGCANPRLPGLYTNVASYLDWIHDKLSTKSVKFPDESRSDKVGGQSEPEIMVRRGEPTRSTSVVFPRDGR